MNKELPTSPDKLTQVLRDSIQIERMLAENHRDIQKVQTTRKKLRDLIEKFSVKS